jgi:hypothetical protein
MERTMSKKRTGKKAPRRRTQTAARKLARDVGLLASLLPYLRTNPEYLEILRGSLGAQGRHDDVRQLDRLSAAALRHFGGGHFNAETAEQLRRFLRPLVADAVLEAPFGYYVGDVLFLSFGQAADLLEGEIQAPGRGQPGPPTGGVKTDPLAGAPGRPPEGGRDELALDAVSESILRALKDNPNRRLSPLRIKRESKEIVSLTTTKRRLKELLEKKLIKKPAGRSGGYAITATGLRLISELPPAGCK